MLIKQNYTTNTINKSRKPKTKGSGLEWLGGGGGGVATLVHIGIKANIYYNIFSICIYIFQKFWPLK